jgi:probable F420-dependent oxidoreductase
MDIRASGGMLAPIPAMMAAAAATSTIKVGPLVSGVDFHNPAVLAREAATVDLLSDGRFVLGLGAGWLERDYAIAGIRYDSAGTRIDRLGEAVRVIRGVWSGKPFSFSGEHYEVAESIGYPAPLSSIPILIGGGGKKVLSLASQEADIVGIMLKIVGGSVNQEWLPTAVSGALDDKVCWVKQAAGERYDQIELALPVFVSIVTETPVVVAEQVAPIFGLSPEAVLASPYFQIASVAGIVERLQAIRERWDISYICFQPNATEEMAPVVAALAGR